MMTRATNQQATSGRTLSMRLTVTLVAVALIATTVVTLGVLNERYVRRTLTEEVQGRLLVEARNLASSASTALLDDYPELILQPLVNEIMSDREELAFAVVVDHLGNIQGHQDAWELGRAFERPKGLAASAMGVNLHPREQMLANDDLIVAMAPSVHENDQLVGTAILALHRDHLESRLAQARRLHLIVVTVMLLLGSALAMLVMSRLLRPIGDLAAGLERIGRGDLDTPVELGGRTELVALATRINDMALDLKQAQVEMVQRERLSHEMELAREIQESLLPGKEQRVSDFVIRGEQAAASEVGGDFYDVFFLPDGRLGLVVADVAGKGMAGCLATSMLAAFLRAYSGLHSSPSSLLEALDQQLCQALPLGTFVTMFYAILDTDTGELVFASAGHGPMLIYRADPGTTAWHDVPGVPLASVRKQNRRPSWGEGNLELRPGDVLLQFTDGVNEAWSKSGDEQFGFDRVQAIVEQQAKSGGEAVLRKVRAEVARWSGGNALHDDETLLVVTREVPNVDREFLHYSSPESDAEFHQLLEKAREAGHRLEFPPQLEALVILRDWVTTCEGLQSLDRNESGVLITALYEYCANIVEHGYESQRGDPIELYWLPGANGDDVLGDRSFYDEKIMQAARVVRGCFLIVDHGRPYDPSIWEPLDFEDPATRRSGRGMGLQIIHSSMWKITYLPASPAGNVTFLKYNPVKHWHATEVSHV